MPRLECCEGHSLVSCEDVFDSTAFPAEVGTERQRKIQILWGILSCRILSALHTVHILSAAGTSLSTYVCSRPGGEFVKELHCSVDLFAITHRSPLNRFGK